MVTPPRNNDGVLKQDAPPAAAATAAPINLHINLEVWKINPILWFLQLESQFHMNGITGSETKYHVAVVALDSSVINQVSEVVMQSPAANLMYEMLKQRL